MEVSSVSMPMSSKKIIQFIPELDAGGAETVVKDYAIELHRQGYNVEVMVLLSNPNAANEKTIRNAGIPIVSLANSNQQVGQHKIFEILHKINRDIEIRKNLKKHLHENHPAVLHVHLNCMRFIMGCSKELKDTKICFTCHSEPNAVFEQTGWRSLLENVSIRKYLKRGNLQIIALHKAAALQVDKIFNINTTTYLNNPLDIARFQMAAKERGHYRKQLGISENDFVLGHVGRFASVKNHQFLVEVFASICERCENAKLLLVGSGVYLSSVQALLSKYGLAEKCIILSNRSDIPQLFAAMDVFCLPSKYEGMPVSLLEAQAAGKKCVVSNTVTKDVVVSNKVYYLGLNQPIHEWVDVILENNAIAEPCAQTLNDFDITTVCNNLLSLYFGNDGEDE